MERECIARAVVDVLIMRQELAKHDIDPVVAEQMFAAAMPAFVTWEASQP